jgi:hypothetical protein
MKYWRMQLHPDDSGNSAFHSGESLSAGFIGLDFAAVVGDLSIESIENIPNHQRDYLAFANQMEVGDKVLIISHHFPFAVCTISGEYNYIKTPVPELGVWFRHFRRVNEVKYYADFVTNARSWEQIIMTDTISPLVSEGTLSLNLIREMYSKA